MKVKDLIDEIEGESPSLQYIISWGFQEGYYVDEDGQFWQIRKVDSNDI